MAKLCQTEQKDKESATTDCWVFLDWQNQQIGKKSQAVDRGDNPPTEHTPRLQEALGLAAEHHDDRQHQKDMDRHKDDKDVTLFEQNQDELNGLNQKLKNRTA